MKTDNQRSISIRASTWDRVKAHAASLGVKPTTLIERQLIAFLNEKAPRQ